MDVCSAVTHVEMSEAEREEGQQVLVGEQSID